MLLSLTIWSAAEVSADDFSYIDANGKKITVQIAPGSKPPPLPAGAKPIQEDGKSKAGKDSDDTADDADPPEPKVIRRDSETDQSSNSKEFDVGVGDDGKVAFEFRNQPWVELIQWLSDISDQPLDWLELPGDRVNLRSPGRYTVSETRDLFNRYLLARGYTLLEIDGGLTVAKTATINPAMVPRVAPEILDSLPPHSFVRTSLDVGWLSAEKLAEELAPMISGNGKLTALSTTNRIEAMDAAINLKQIAILLDQERSLRSRESLAPEFVLRHLPAEEAKRMLEEFLGVEKKKESVLTPQQIQQMQQQRQQNGKADPQPKKIEISIVANVRRNSILIRAAADRVAIATEFLKRVDVPGDGIKNLMDVQSRVQVFRLASLDPEKLIEIVSEMNVLEPGTRIRVDKENNAIIVSGSMADRYIINSLIQRLDGSSRSFEVMPLRRLDPSEVAESIAFLMGQKKEDKKQSSRRSYYSSYYGRNDDQEKDEDEFRVAANTRLRQILLWANEQEMTQVCSLLVKLGELPPPGGSSQTIRMLESSATPETLEYLQRLKRQWNRLSPNPIELPPPNQFDRSSEIDAEKAEDNQSDDQQRVAPEKTETPIEEDTVANDANGPTLMFPRRYQTLVQNIARETSGAPAPIRIELDSQGNLILNSSDTAALDQLENLMLQMKPPQRPYRIFHVKHASAYWMRLNLENYFRDADAEDSSKSDSFFRWYWGDDSNDKNEKPKGLGKGNSLRFVDDIDTSTLVVTGAGAQQLKTIEELISLWDVSEPVNKRKTRFTKLVAINFGKADKIAETVKEAYRDLLSSNDKAFTGNRGGGGGGGSSKGGRSGDVSKSRNGDGSELEDSQSGRNGGGAEFSFKGKLSIGVDPVGNTLLVSAEGEPLLNLVSDMIDQLDQAARPQGEVKIVKLSGGINGETLRKALESFSKVRSSSSSDTKSNRGSRDRTNSRSQRRNNASDGD